MAYAPNNLSALTYANGFTLWHYKTADTAEEVDTEGYFNAAAGMLRVGDFVFANTNTEVAIESGVFIVKTSSGGVVNVTNISTFGTADTD
jgi:outer membrane protein assembly factor BamB